MSTDLDLKQTERNSFKLANYADGTGDISLGLVMILMGIYPFSRELLGVSGNLLFSLAVLGLIFTLQVLIKKRLGPSRIGMVTFGERIQKRLKIAVLVGIILFFLVVGTWYLSSQGYYLPSPSWLGSYGFDILIGLVVLVIFGAMAYTMEMTRYYLYGLLLGACFPLQTVLPVYQGLPYLISGAIIIGFGSVLLARFLHKYPANAADSIEEGV